MRLGSADLQRLSTLLDQALEIPRAERETWLESLQGDALALARTLRELLAKHARHETGDLIDRLPAFTVAPDPAAASALAAGDIVGPYRLVRELGQGGMGEVWLAERIDGQLKRPVALKLPMLGARRSVLVQRFARERDILGALAHPHIARLYDAGLADDGQPYLALEYVDGQPIVHWCDSRKLAPRARVELLLQVMSAVQYAHANLVIHRDLKPSNVLVTSEGQAMLLDFGIAKLVQEVQGEAIETELTRIGGRALTPGYAAPEQVSGAPISIATDVWALGVLLYELLAGQRPFGGARHEVEKAILTQEPAKPKAMPADLATIALKALKKEPSERYATVNAFAEDLGRWLRNEPVLAQADRLGYRLRKFVGRYRLPVALGGGALAALVVGAGVAAWQAHEAAQERDRALVLLARSDAVAEFLGLLLTEAGHVQRPITVNELLARSEALADESFRHAPEQQAQVLSILGMRSYALAEGQRAEALLRRAQERARESRDASFKARLSCQHAAVLESIGRLDEARQTLGSNARRGDIDPAVAAECLEYLAQVEVTANNGAAAVALMQQSLQMRRLVRAASPFAEAKALGVLADALSQSGRNDEALHEFAKSHAIFKRLGRETSDDAINLRNAWSVVYGDAGDVKGARALIEENLAVATRRTPGEPPPTHLLVNRARALELLGRTEDAAAAYRVALAAVEAEATPLWIFLCLSGMIGVALDRGDVDEAGRLLRRIDALPAESRPAGSVFAKVEHLARGRVALALGRGAAADAAFTIALGDRPPIASTVVALTRRAEAGLLEGQLDQASKDAQEALALAQKLQGGLPYSWRTGVAWLVQGRVVARQGDLPRAREAYEAALRHLSVTVDPAHPALRQVQGLLSRD